jgi:hypothetical protein
MEVAVLPLDCVLDAITTLLTLNTGKIESNGDQTTLCSVCASVGIVPHSVCGNYLKKTTLIVAILKHQFEKHQYTVNLPMNSRIDLLAPTRRERSEGETRVLELSHRSIGVQTDSILLPTLSETLCSLTTPRVVSVDVSTHTDNRRQSTGTVSTRNNRFLSPTIPVPFTSPLKRASTTPEPETATPQN